MTDNFATFVGQITSRFDGQQKADFIALLKRIGPFQVLFSLLVIASAGLISATLLDTLRGSGNGAYAESVLRGAQMSASSQRVSLADLAERLPDHWSKTLTQSSNGDTVFANVPLRATDATGPSILVTIQERTVVGSGFLTNRYSPNPRLASYINADPSLVTTTVDVAGTSVPVRCSPVPPEATLSRQCLMETRLAGKFDIQIMASRDLTLGESGRVALQSTVRDISRAIGRATQ